ncbi:hypothetical protein [uncultured Tenacibaculum sp.]|uniref:hypothetical protein n=1 Tax=uncultured Tenacibaculum sp. TaxID=174713 RepID=UPI00262A9FA5|nr:hypothetical protein [uncultured Tenacibaculum sp.]
MSKNYNKDYDKDTYSNGNPRKDSYGRALTYNGKYYSGAQFGYTKESYDYLARQPKSDSTKQVNRNKFWINGFNISKKAGKITFSGIENSSSLRYTGEKNGKKHIMLFIEIFYHNTGNTVVEYIDFCIDSKTALVPKLNMFIDCSTKGGGSFNRIIKALK